MTTKQRKTKEPHPQENARKEQGGGSSISLDITPADIAELEGEGGEVPAAEAQAMINRALIDGTCKVINQLAETATGYKEMALTKEEIEVLIALWMPVLPEISPMLAAIFGTTVIIGGKAVLFMNLKRQERSKIPPIRE